jgi:hypothetical protein
MKTILIYDDSEYEYESNVVVKEFNSKEQMVEFVNTEKIGKSIIACYEVFKEIKFKPVEKITLWDIDS